MAAIQKWNETLVVAMYRPTVQVVASWGPISLCNSYWCSCKSMFFTAEVVSLIRYLFQIIGTVSVGSFLDPDVVSRNSSNWCVFYVCVRETPSSNRQHDILTVSGRTSLYPWFRPLHVAIIKDSFSPESHWMVAYKISFMLPSYTAYYRTYLKSRFWISVRSRNSWYTLHRIS